MFDYGQSETVGDKETSKDDAWTEEGRGRTGGWGDEGVVMRVKRKAGVSQNQGQLHQSTGGVNWGGRAEETLHHCFPSGG